MFKNVTIILIVFAIACFFYLVNDILFPFILAIVLAYLLNPLTIKLEKVGLSRNLAITTIILGFFIILISFLILLAPLISMQISEFILKIPTYKDLVLEKLMPFLKELSKKTNPYYVDKFQEHLNGFASNLPKIFLNLAAKLWDSSKGIVNLLSVIFITPIITFYLLQDFNKIKKSAITLIPVYLKKEVSFITTKINHNLSAYLHGQVNVCLILAVYYSITLSLASLEFAIGIGFLNGILSFIPYAGFLIGLLIAMLVAFFQWGLTINTLIVFIIMIVGNAIEGNYLTPKLIGEKIGIHPVWIIFSLFAGASLAGLTGVIIAIPCAAILSVLLKYFINIYLKSEIYR